MIVDIGVLGDIVDVRVCTEGVVRICGSVVGARPFHGNGGDIGLGRLLDDRRGRITKPHTASTNWTSFSYVRDLHLPHDFDYLLGLSNLNREIADLRLLLCQYLVAFHPRVRLFRLPYPDLVVRSSALLYEHLFVACERVNALFELGDSLLV